MTDFQPPPANLYAWGTREEVNTTITAVAAELGDDGRIFRSINVEEIADDEEELFGVYCPNVKRRTECHAIVRRAAAAVDPERRVIRDGDVFRGPETLRP